MWSQPGVQRRAIWRDLRIINPGDEAWCIVGDFNSILAVEERGGESEGCVAETVEFRECVKAIEVGEMITIGPFLTWQNGNRRARLDRDSHGHRYSQLRLW